MKNLSTSQDENQPPSTFYFSQSESLTMDENEMAATLHLWL